MSKVKVALKRVGVALMSKDARPAEMVLARIILAALGVKLGINFAGYVQ